MKCYLIQAWIYEHFPALGRKQLRNTYVETKPRAIRYVTGRVISAIIDIRLQLDALTYDGMIWRGIIPGSYRANSHAHGRP